MIEWEHAAAQQEKDQIQAVCPRQGRFGTEHASHCQSQAGKRRRAQDKRQQRCRQRSLWLPAIDANSNSNEQRYLCSFQHQHRQHFGGDQSSARKGRATQTLQHTIIALIRGGNAQAYHTSCHDSQRQHPRKQKINRPNARRDNVEGRKKDEQDHRHNDRNKHTFAAPDGQQKLNPRLSQYRAQKQPGARSGCAAPCLWWFIGLFYRRCCAHRRTSVPVNSRKISSSEPCPTRNSVKVMPWSRSQAVNSASSAGVWAAFIM